MGRFKAPATFTSGDAFSINGKAAPAYVGANAVDADTIVKDRWVLFTYDGTQLNFNGGGGLGANKLALATAEPDDVLDGKKYYAKIRQSRLVICLYSPRPFPLSPTASEAETSMRVFPRALIRMTLAQGIQRL